MSQKEVESALRAADETKFLRIAAHACDDTIEIFKGQFPGEKGVIVSDRNTYRAVGEKIHGRLKEAGLELAEPMVIDDAGLYGNYRYVTQVRSYLAPLDAIPIAVGSGVINDLTKLASHELGRSYMCVATAASMDGYSAFGASITKDGAKQTMACSAPRAIVADLGVIAGAPPVNNASGYADLYAKVPAGADWIVADALGIEPLDGKSWHIVQDGLKEALQDPEGIRSADPRALELLTEGLMLGGFAMQSLKSSRPASGAEHQFSHLWDMEHHTFKGEVARQFGLYKDRDEQAPSHGFKVGIGLLTTTALYERVLATPLETLDVAAAVARWEPLEEQISEVNRMFSEAGPRAFATDQVSKKYITPAELEHQLTLLKSIWPGLKQRLSAQIIPYHQSRKNLMAAGAPVDPEQIGITRQRLRESFYKAQKLRTRFTVLDLAVRTGYLDTWVDELFGENGVLKSID